MQNETTNAEKTLAVCLQRGQEALNCLLKGQIQEALDVMRKRRMAFCNFRYYSADEHVSDGSVERVLQQDESLEEALQSAMRELVAQRSNLVRGRQHLSKFQSSSQNLYGFQRSI